VWDTCGQTSFLKLLLFLRYRVFSNLLILRATFESNSVPGHHNRTHSFSVEIDSILTFESVVVRALVIFGPCLLS
jgi:hypothetical protein